MDAWVYINSEPGLWTVGYYEPSGQFQPESDHRDSDEAAKRTHYLNGGTDENLRTAAVVEAKAIERLMEDRVQHLTALRQIANMTETGVIAKGGRDVYEIAVAAIEGTTDTGRRLVNREASLRNERAAVGLKDA